MRKLLFIISLLIMNNVSYSQEDTLNTEEQTEEITQQEESESTLDFMLSPTLGFNLQNNSFERDNEVLTAQWLGSLRSKLDIYGDVFNFNSSLTAQYGQVISKGEHPVTTQDKLTVSLMPSMELFKSFQLRLFFDNVVQTSMDYNENYGNPTTFLDPAYIYHTLFLGQDYKWSNEDYTSSFNIIYGVGYAVQETYTKNYVLEENKNIVIDEGNPLSDVQNHFTLTSGYSGIIKFTYNTALGNDFSFYTDFSLAAITKDSFFEDINQVSVNGIFYTSLKYKFLSIDYSANLTYDEQIYSHRQLQQTLTLGFTHTFNF